MRKLRVNASRTRTILSNSASLSGNGSERTNLVNRGFQRPAFSQRRRGALFGQPPPIDIKAPVFLYPNGSPGFVRPNGSYRRQRSRICASDTPFRGAANSVATVGKGRWQWTRGLSLCCCTFLFPSAEAVYATTWKRTQPIELQLLTVATLWNDSSIRKMRVPEPIMSVIITMCLQGRFLRINSGPGESRT